LGSKRAKAHENMRTLFFQSTATRNMVLMQVDIIGRKLFFMFHKQNRPPNPDMQDTFREIRNMLIFECSPDL
jgi:hypothetical protein